jgi:acetyltransferase
MFGAGGTAVEVMRDTAMSLLPLDRPLARDLMRQTRINRLLEGYRDRPPADLDAIVTVIVRLGELVVAHPEIREIDINPLLADDAGTIALDARVRVESPERSQRRPLSIRPYPAHWTRNDTIEGLGAVTIRPIKPEDERLYARFIERMAPEDMRMRFFIARPHLSHQLIARLTQIDYAREMAFVALAADGALLGVVRMVADPDYTRAEYAVLVRSDLKGRGLGWRLMKHLIDYAKAEKLAQLQGAVLADNTTMLQMCRDLGFAVEPEPGDNTVRRVRLQFA